LEDCPGHLHRDRERVPTGEGSHSRAPASSDIDATAEPWILSDRLPLIRISVMARDPAASFRRALVALALLAGLWAVVVALTGGFRLTLAGIRISSRSTTNPMLVALISTCALVGLSLRSGANWRAQVYEDLRWWTHALHLRRISGWLLHPVTLTALAGALLRLQDWASGRPLWLDEQMIALNIRERPVSELTGALWLDQSAPLGWLATERAAMLAFGVSETALRFVPLMFGIAVLAAALWIGRRWMSAIAACALVLLCSLGEWVFHYSLELKHYSADLFFALVIPALVVWTTEADGPDERLRRASVWWVVAAAGLWWANGALLVAPACALTLVISLWRIDGRKNATVFAATGLFWLASLAAHYYLALRFTLENDRLRETWSFAMPPLRAGVLDTARWLISQTQTFTTRPGGSELTALFWVVVLAGVLFARPRLFGQLVAVVTLSMCVLAAMRLVPLYERFAIWVVPSLYLGIAFCVDAGIRAGRNAYDQRRHLRAATAALVIAAVLWLCGNVAAGGWRAIQIARSDNSNHQLDDRMAVEWLVAQHERGDVVLTTRLGMPAVWWYGGAPVSSPTLGGFLRDRIPILEVDHVEQGRTCHSDDLRRALLTYRRALVYLGFRFDDVPPGFDDFLLQELHKVGHVREPQRFPGVTRVLVVEIDPSRQQSARATTAPDSPTSTGCISVRPARRW